MKPSMWFRAALVVNGITSAVWFIHGILVFRKTGWGSSVHEFSLAAIYALLVVVSSIIIKRIK